MFRLIAWLAGLLFVIGLLWAATETEVARDEQERRKVAAQQAVSLANGYAAQLMQLAAQMDRLTLSVAYRWQDEPARVNLLRDHARGLFPRHHEFFIAIIDASGHPVRTSFPLRPGTDFSGVDFFVKQRSGCCDGLLISRPEFGQLTGKPLIRFSRRLHSADGHFAGVVVVSVLPDYIATLQDDSQQGENDFVTSRLQDGTFLATRLGHGVQEARVFYKEPPVFVPVQGVRFEQGDKFIDARARFVAWHRIEPYRLVAIAGLTEEHILAAHQPLARGYRIGAWVATVFLSLLALGGILISVHVARRHRADEDVRRTYRMATDAANEGFYMLSPLLDDRGKLWDFRIEDCNERGAALLGLHRSHLAGRRAKDALAPAARAELVAICAKAMENGLCEDEQRVPAHGWLRAAWVYRRAVHSGSGIALTLRDISELKSHEQALSELANNDPLTQLPNRRWLLNYLPAAMQRTSRGNGRLALFFIDLDNFKEVNDTLGHQAGDELLLQAAARIGETVRSTDRVVRLGGDEFTVVLENADGDEALERVAAGIIARMSEPFALAGACGGRVSASIGISVFPEHGHDADSLLKHADVAMYAAKAAGKGRYQLYRAALSELLLQRLAEEHALRQAIGRGEFVVHYQPRVSAATGRLSSVEALVRWQHPQRGLLSPAEFIDIAENAGLIVQISEIVVEQVADQLARWRQQGLGLVPVSVNVSPRQLQAGRTAACLERALERHALPASVLEVEITESAMVDRGASTSRDLDAIRALGIRLMIDDFGTGYSSLAQLHRLDVDVLKVDQAFTRALAQGSEGELMYRAIVSMASALGMRVVAEGVETAEQLRLLQAIGCDEIQGHIISAAVPATTIAEMARMEQLQWVERSRPRLQPVRAEGS